MENGYICTLKNEGLSMIYWAYYPFKLSSRSQTVVKKPPFTNRIHETECLAISLGERWREQFSIDKSVWSPCPCMERKLTSQPVFVVPFSAKPNHVRNVGLAALNWKTKYCFTSFLCFACRQVALHQFNYSFHLNLFLFNASFSIKLQPSLVLLRMRTSKCW